jgi:quercetin dioxygenase-like cupin family protein
VNKKWAAGLIATTLGVGACSSNVLATPSSGVSTTLIEHAVFDALHLQAQSTPTGRWGADMSTYGQSDLYVSVNKFTAGGTTGWHSHPGPSFLLVVSGTVTNYSSAQPGCAGQTYAAGQGFLDPGGSEVHMVRDNGSVEAETIAVQFVAHGDSRKTAAKQPAHCSV